MTVVRVLDQAASHWPIQLGRTPRAGFLEPALTPRVVACHHCGGRVKVPRLLVSVRVNCTNEWSTTPLTTGLLTSSFPVVTDRSTTDGPFSYTDGIGNTT